MSKAKPFIKWVGGKGQLIEQLEALLPVDSDDWRYLKESKKMNTVILDYNTGNVDFRSIPVDINDNEAVEEYLFNVLDYSADHIYYMCGDKITINTFYEK